MVEIVEQAQYYLHDNPVWYQLPHYTLILPVDGSHSEYEQLVTEELGNNEYRLLCIPFFLYDVALGDVVRTEHLIPKSASDFEVVAKSGRYVFRVWFENTPEVVKRTCLKDVKSMGALTERSSKLLYAIDAENLELAQKVSGYLMEGQSAGNWIYETGQT